MEDNDHRVLGKKLDLYHIQDDASGMVFWHPRGHVLYRVLEDYIRGHMRRLGYEEVRTPQLMPQSLWERSGHWEKFRENMFCVPGDDDRGDMALKPMSCPCHIQIFNQGVRSWRQLPVRLCEFGACHRNEPSGSMHGLMRTRAFEQDDAHVFCRASDVRSEISRFIGLLDCVYRELGFSDYSVALSTRPHNRAGSDEHWDWAEGELRSALSDNGIEYEHIPGEGAFYGPKIEFILKDRQGRSWQCGTVQLDCVLPERLKASYVDQDGSKKVPVMIHHAVLGSIGRFIAILLEHYEGSLPLWLSPEQVAVIPISEKHWGYANSVNELLKQTGVRSRLFDMNESLSRKIVMAKEEKVPILCIVGAKEEAERAMSIKSPEGKQMKISLEEGVEQINAMIFRRIASNLG